jgi:hypothetical protein
MNIKFGRKSKKIITSPTTELSVIEKGRYTTLVQHASENHYGNKRYKCNFKIKGDNVVCWMDEDTNFKEYNNFNLN